MNHSVWKALRNGWDNKDLPHAINIYFAALFKVWHCETQGEETGKERGSTGWWGRRIN